MPRDKKEPKRIFPSRKQQPSYPSLKLRSTKGKGKRDILFCILFLKIFFTMRYPKPHVIIFFFKLCFMLILVLKYDFCMVYNFCFTLMIMMWFMDMVCGWRNLLLKVSNEQEIVYY